MRGLYRIHDRGLESGCFFVKNEAEARAYNVGGWGIFRCVNEMKSERRAKDNVERIAYWAVDVDLGKNNSYQSK